MLKRAILHKLLLCRLMCAFDKWKLALLVPLQLIFYQNGWKKSNKRKKTACGSLQSDSTNWIISVSIRSGNLAFDSPAHREQIACRDCTVIPSDYQCSGAFSSQPRRETEETVGDIPHIFSLFKEKYVKTQTSLKLKTLPIEL